MLIAVVSDTHGSSKAIDWIIEKTKDADMIIHLGDHARDAEEIERRTKTKVIYVYGNCDYKGNGAEERLEKIGDKKIFMTHGHSYGVKYGIDKLYKKAKALKADIVLYGHTHVSSILNFEGIYFINPGSAANGRDGNESIAIIYIDKDDIKVDLELIE